MDDYKEIQKAAKWATSWKRKFRPVAKGEILKNQMKNTVKPSLTRNSRNEKGYADYLKNKKWNFSIK